MIRSVFQNLASRCHLLKFGTLRKTAVMFMSGLGGSAEENGQHDLSARNVSYSLCCDEQKKMTRESLTTSMKTRLSQKDALRIYIESLREWSSQSLVFGADGDGTYDVSSSTVKFRRRSLGSVHISTYKEKEQNAIMEVRMAQCIEHRQACQTNISRKGKHDCKNQKKATNSTT